MGNSGRSPPDTTGRSARHDRRSTKRGRKGERLRGVRRIRAAVLRLLGYAAWKLIRLFWAVGWRVGLVIGLIVALDVGRILFALPEASTLLDGRSRGSVTFLDRKGTPFAWRGDQFGGIVTTDTVSPHLKNAIIATEDRRFYRHYGISPRGVASAVWINLREGRGPLSGHGGSTITQQTAKLLCLGVPYDRNSGLTEAEYETRCRETSLWRKMREATYALAMEVKYTKNEILTVYMNRAFLGAGARGFEAAAQRYFGKTAATVNPAESAMLAGLLVAPTRYAPTRNLVRAQDRAALILGLMERQGYLTAEQVGVARANPAVLSNAAAEKAGGYFADWIMEAAPRSLTSQATKDVIMRTTLDREIQLSAEYALDHVFAEFVRPGSRAQAAIVVMSPDGAVRAMVGGRRTKVAGAFNRATQALRQTGSAFKPFVYAAALEQGYDPYDTVVDEPFCMAVPGNRKWCPRNHSGEFLGRVTLAQALRDSINVPAVKVARHVGLERVRRLASGFGIGRGLVEGPSLALGASESTLLEMTGAYAGILNGGHSVKPYGLVELRFLNDSRPLLTGGGRDGERVIRRKTAEQLVSMMIGVVSDGTGRRAALPGRQVAGKTGTTQAARDAWFIGFTADYIAGVWMGYDDNTPLRGVTGGGLPAEIWKQVMMRVHMNLEARPLPLQMSEVTGRVRGPGFPDGRTE